MQIRTSIRSKLMLIFILIIFTNVLYGLYSASIFVNLNKIESVNNGINTVLGNIYKIEIDKLAYNNSGEWTFSVDVLSEIESMKANIEKLIDTDDESLKSDLESIHENLTLYSSAFNDLINIFNQNAALEISLNDNLSELVTHLNLYKKTEIDKADIISVNDLIILSTHNSKLIFSSESGVFNKSEYDEVISILDEIVIHTEINMLNFETPEEKLYYIRLINKVNNYKENLEKVYRLSMLKLDNDTFIKETHDSLINQTERLYALRKKTESNIVNALEYAYFPLLLLTIAIFIIMIRKILMTLKNRLSGVILATFNMSLGDYSEFHNLEREDEFDQLILSLDSLRKKLYETTSELERSNEMLEEKVELKTLELIESNNKLEEAYELLKKDQEELSIIATSDYLTGAKTRGFIIDEIRQRIKEYKRYKKSFCIMILDIDSFKSINDNYGHLVGDEALSFITSFLKSRLRETDIIGRYGGDEFIIIFPESNVNDVFRTVEVIRREISRTPLSVEKIKLTISGGLTEYTEGDVNQLIKQVDDKLYEAKNQGRNKIVK